MVPFITGRCSGDRGKAETREEKCESPLKDKCVEITGANADAPHLLHNFEEERFTIVDGLARATSFFVPRRYVFDAPYGDTLAFFVLRGSTGHLTMPESGLTHLLDPRLVLAATVVMMLQGWI